MKKFLTYISVLLFFIGFAVSCGGRKSAEPVIVERTKTITEKVHDTIFKVEKDSAFYQSFVECRDGKPFIVKDSIIYKEGKNVTTTVYLKDNKLSVDCNQKALELFKTWKSQYVRETVPQVVFKDKIIEVAKPLKWWQKALMWTGGISFLTFVLGMLYTIFKPKFL